MKVGSVVVLKFFGVCSPRDAAAVEIIEENFTCIFHILGTSVVQSPYSHFLRAWSLLRASRSRLMFHGLVQTF